MQIQNGRQSTTARKQIESKTGKRAISRYNFKSAQEQKKLKGEKNIPTFLRK